MKLKQKMGLNMFDLLKGVIIILVVVRHSFDTPAFTETLIGKIIYSVAMPSLFLVSGYWLNKRNLKTGLRNSVRDLLIPSLTVLAIIIAVSGVHRALIHNLREWLDVFVVRSLLVRSDIGRITPIWFMFALFVAWCAFYIVVNAFGERGQIIAVCLCAITGGLLMPLHLPFQISQGLIALFYVYAGYQIKRRKLLQRALHPLALLGLLALWVAGFLFGSMELSDYSVRNFLLSVPGGLCSAFLLVRLFLYLNSIEWKILDPIRWVGRYSMWILCIHTTEAAVFPWKIMFLFVDRVSLAGGCCFFVLRWILIVAVCRAMIWLKQRKLTHSRIA